MNTNQHSDDGHAGLISRCKGFLRRFPLLFSTGKNLRYLYFALRSGLWLVLFRNSHRRSAGRMPQIRQWSIRFPHLDTASDLCDWLREQGVSLIDAEHAIYLPPQQALSTVIPEMADFYPPGSGFKILKDFRAPEQANYLAGRAGSVAIRRRLTGPPFEQKITANYLHSLGIGPRMWDLCYWQGNGNELTVFVVEHVAGTVPSTEDCQAFLQRLRAIVRESHVRILMPRWETQDDFECPACRGNLFQSSRHDRLQYVDFQNFRLVNPNAWTREVSREDGSANVTIRPTAVISEMSRQGIDVAGRMVLQLDCGLGELLSEALLRGADWGFGWTDAESRDRAESSLFSRGFSRFNIFERNSLKTAKLADTVSPQLQTQLTQAILLCQLDRGLPDDFVQLLQSLPWQVLVCIHDETSETVEAITQQLNSSSIRVTCQANNTIRDDDGHVGSIATFCRITNEHVGVQHE